MKKQLELKHVAPYLPYGVKAETPNGIQEIKGIDTALDAIGLNYWVDGLKRTSFSIDCRLRLRPLSDLTKEIEHNGDKFVPSKVLSAWDLEGITIIDMPHIPANLYDLLLKWKFDVFGLIEDGLAVDINTI